MNKEEFEADFALYTDPQGLVQNSPHPSLGQSGNGNLFTAEYHMLKYLLGFSDPLDLNRWELCTAGNQIPDYPGLFRRSVLDTDGTSVDEYIGLTSAAAIVGSHIRFDILVYLLDNWTFLNTEHPGKKELKAFFGRFPAFIAHCFVACGHKPNLLLRVSWSVTVALTAAFTRQEDGWILSWLLVNTYLKMKKDKPELDSWLMNRAVISFNKRLKRNWGTIADVFEAYFNDEGNPIVKWSRCLP